jgi:hypothetical protein
MLIYTPHLAATPPPHPPMEMAHILKRKTSGLGLDHANQ